MGLFPNYCVVLLEQCAEYLGSGSYWVFPLDVRVLQCLFSAPSGDKELAPIAVPCMGKSQQLELVGELLVLHILI